MSLFDNIMNENPKKTKQSGNKKNTDSLFKEEYSDELNNDVSQYGIQSYSKSGVTFEKISDSQAKISYSGLLAKGGAQEVNGVYGYGSNQNWEGVSTLTLNNGDSGSFEAIMSLEQGKNVNIAFKDCAENWDNNSGMNYTFVN